MEGFIIGFITCLAIVALLGAYINKRKGSDFMEDMPDVESRRL